MSGFVLVGWLVGFVRLVPSGPSLVCLLAVFPSQVQRAQTRAERKAALEEERKKRKEAKGEGKGKEPKGSKGRKGCFWKPSNYCI